MKILCQGENVNPASNDVVVKVSRPLKIESIMGLGWYRSQRLVDDLYIIIGVI